MSYFDLHCDTLLHYFNDPDFNLYQSAAASVDIKRLHESGVMAQCFAICLPEAKTLKARGWTDDQFIRFTAERFYEAVAAHDDVIRTAKSVAEILANHAAGRTSAILSIEDGRGVGGDLEKLREYHDLGVRLLTLTWFDENCFGSPSSDDPLVMNKPLSEFGRTAIPLLNELGIVIDVSHLSDGGFWQLIDLSEKPFVASHSNCRALVPHFRNLDDDMIRALAQKGGVMGLNFCSIFLDPANRIGAEIKNLMTDLLFDGRNELPPGVSRIEDMVRHVLHAYKVGGADVLAIGTDFDGMSPLGLEISSPLQMDRLFTALRRAGLPAAALDAMLTKNVLRVFRDNAS